MRYRRALAADVMAGFWDNRKHTLTRLATADAENAGVGARDDESEGLSEAGWLDSGWLGEGVGAGMRYYHIQTWRNFRWAVT